MNSIFHRTSIRRYVDTPVEPEKIELILRAAMAAPSAHNQQPWEFYVVTDKAVLQKLSECTQYTRYLKYATVAFVPCYRLETIMPEYHHIDMSAATENMLLQIDELGLGAVWLGIAPDEGRMKYVEETLSIPSHLRAFAMVACGYPGVEKQQQDRYDESRVHYVK